MFLKYAFPRHTFFSKDVVPVQGDEIDLSGSAIDLRRQLLSAGLSKNAIDAAWPEWWQDAGDDSPSARSELRYALARRLGLSPRALLVERVEATRGHDAKFKHLSAESEVQQALLASFGTALGNLLLRATPASPMRLDPDPLELRKAILTSKPFVGLDSLVATCWGLGIPLIQLRVFPLDAKSMHAMVTRSGDRHAIMVGFDANYPARAAFTVAHEIGHIALGHVGPAGSIVDLKEVGLPGETDDQEMEADRYALTLLTGSPDLEITTSLTKYNGTSLAAAVVAQAPPLGIEPGTLALCVAYRTGEWAKTMSALAKIYGGPMEMWRFLNGFADGQLDWSDLGDEAGDYLKRVMGAGD